MCEHGRVQVPWRCAAVVATLGWAGVARGVVDVQPTAHGRIEGRAVRVTLSVTNAGSDTAYAVMPDVEVDGARGQGAAVPELEGGEAQAWQLTLPAPAGPGAYPVVARVRYTDARGTPLSAVTVDVACTGACALESLHVAFPAWTLFVEEGYLVSVAVDNGGPAPIAGQLRAVLADELPVDLERQAVAVPAGGHVDVPVVIRNAHAQPGGAYTAWAIVEVDEAGGHRTVVARTPVLVTEGAERAASGAAAVVAAALLGAVGVSGTWRFMRGRPPWRRRRAARKT